MANPNVDDIERILMNLPEDSIDAIMMKLLKAKMSKREREAGEKQSEETSGSESVTKKLKPQTSTKSEQDEVSYANILQKLIK
eukprot:564748-Hanusia_phi.AAC.1